MDVQFFQNDKGTTAFKQSVTGSPVGVFFLPGHRNVFDSHKCLWIEKICQKNNISCTHFVYYGWDQSQSDAVPKDGEGYVHHWLQQALDLFDAKTQGPQILCGYSMGGYMALALAALRPDRVQGIIGLASGFGSGLVEQIIQHYGDKSVGTLNENIFTFDMHDDFSLPIHEKLTINCPVYLAHALSDDKVSHKNTTYIADSVTTDDVTIHLTKDGLHRLGRLEDEEWLEKTISKLAL